jgi:hypothetical protein
MAPPFPDLTVFPEIIIGRNGRTFRRRSCARSACVKCGGGTTTTYSDIGRSFPMCLPCAEKAVRRRREV